jgi:hypothetical protein
MPNRPLRLVRRFFTSCTAAFAAAALACGCGGGGGSPQPAFVAPSPTPSPSPTPPPGGPLAASQSAATFSLAGQSTPVTVNEAGYIGSVAADASACANVASVTPPSATAPATFSITALGSGSCAIGFTDIFGQRATVQVGVTVTQGTIK